MENTNAATAQTKKSTQSQQDIPSSLKWTEVENSIADVKQTFGFVPSFFKNLTEQGIPGAWSEVKAMRFGTNTALDVKLKSLIGLAVSTQIPCSRIAYFDERSSSAEAATRQEQLEAVLMAAITRHWSTVLSGSLMDKTEFRNEADQIMLYVKSMIEKSNGSVPNESMFLADPSASSKETYKDIEATLGLVPKFFRQFPNAGLAGAWSEFKAVQLNPHTSLNGKQKELIGLAVAAQIPCEYCIYFHRKAAALNGATEIEMQEAISLAALTRHWSTIFHGPQTDLQTFQKDADQILAFTSRQAAH